MRNVKRLLVYGAICALLFVALIVSMGVVGGSADGSSTITIKATYAQDDTMQIFYSDTAIVTEEKSVTTGVSASEDSVIYTIEIPEASEFIRIDFGTVENNIVIIEEIELYQGGKAAKIEIEAVNEGYSAGYEIELSETSTILSFATEDPYYLVDTNDLEWDVIEVGIDMFTLVKIAVSAILAVGISIFIFKFVFLKEIVMFLKDIIQNRQLLLSLAINDFKVKFAGSYFGIIWAFVQPICTIAVFWFVFEMGFRSGSVGEVPFALWLSVGLVPWFFFSDSWNGATSTYMEYSHLVKKVVFKIEILPLVKILSALFVHLFFIVFLCVLFLANGVSLTVNVLGVFYYMICLIAFVVGLSFVTSSIVVFFKDLTQIIAIILQFGMWLTPIMWQISTFSGNIIKIMRLNPMFYIIEGYRSCFIASEAVPSINQGVYFWLITVLMFLFGIAIFRRLKPHFADVL